jgi:ureidoglycolate hydrolase
MRYLLILSLVFVTGCSMFSKREPEIVIKTKLVEREPLGLEAPAPLRLKSPEWIIVTEVNLEELIEERKKNPDDFIAFYSLDETGYKQLAINMQELLRLVQEQKLIIVKYKEYYEQTDRSTPVEAETK